MIKLYYEKFLNEIMKHPILRNSLILEIFLTKETKKGMEKAKKEMKKLFSTFILLERNITKKSYDSMHNKNPISLFPHNKKSIELKISSLLKKFFISSDGQYPCYEKLFEKLEKIQKEFVK